jgi:hypothetical protein
MPGSFLASVVDGATAGRRVVTGLAVEAGEVTVVAGGASVVAVVGFGAAVVGSVVVAMVVVVLDAELVPAVTISLDVTAPGDGLGEQAAVITTAIASTSERAGTRRTYAAAP